MKKTILLLVLFTALLTSCSPTYYVYISPEPIKLYPVQSAVGDYVIIEAGQEFIAAGKYDKKSRSRKANYNKGAGYVYHRELKKKRKYKGVFYQPLTEQQYATSRSVKPSTSTNSNSRVSTYSSSSSSSTSNGGPVQVKGYYRKDGTYVRPHTRSAPRRKN